MHCHIVTKMIEIKCFVLFMLYFLHGVNGDTVSYDHEGLIINGQHRILISGSIHYPRAAVEMWPDIISKAREGGIDVIETYVFWNVHEPSKGKYDFDDRYNLIKFIKLVQEAGLYASLRIGPYVCAEWNFGGFPVWLKYTPDMLFRTNSEPFKKEMQAFVEKIVNMMKSEKLFAPQGGPIILAQIENEYGTVEGAYGEAGKEYMLWASRMAVDLNIGVPWIMCKQYDPPEYIIDTCNGFYCDTWTPVHKDKPKMWTENWTGWFRRWGEPTPHRPVEDIAFAVARFFQQGGSFQNYYMYFGGTNFGRTSGGPYITTSYDYDAPIDEFGLIRQPKWGHLKDLHAAIKLTETALTSSNSSYISLGKMQEAYVYGNTEAGTCAAYLANTDPKSDATVMFNGQSYSLPSWSVSILPDCRKVVYNTAKVNAQTATAVMNKQLVANKSELLASGLLWESYNEPVGISDNNGFTSYKLLEQIITTGDTSDYLWYTTSLDVSQGDADGGKPVLAIQSMRDVLHVFVNGQLTGSTTTNGTKLYRSLKLPIKLNAGRNSLDILCATVGLPNGSPFYDTWGAGINGSLLLKGLPSGQIDLTHKQWTYQVALKGERLALFSEQGAGSVSWSSAAPENRPLTWYKTWFDAPSGSEPVALDMGSMGKGHAWVNGQSIGRYWPSFYVPHSAGCSPTCDYRGPYSSNKCTTGCGQLSQQWYHIPRSWLKPSGNLLVLFEEWGGKPSQISIVKRSLIPVS